MSSELKESCDTNKSRAAASRATPMMSLKPCAESELADVLLAMKRRVTTQTVYSIVKLELRAAGPSSDRESVPARSTPALRSVSGRFQRLASATRCDWGTSRGPNTE